jgi:hypothetical protein
MRVGQEKVYMVHNFINKGHQLTTIILVEAVRDIIICNFGGFYGRVVQDSGLLECGTMSLVKCYLTNSCLLHRLLSF